MKTGEARRAIVVGASSGIGAAVAGELAAQGFDLALVARRGALLAEVAERIRKVQPARRVEVYTHDVREVGEAEAIFDRIVEDLHGLNWIVYTAGIMPQIELQEFDIRKDREILEVNLLGAMAWLNAAAAWLSVAREGTIVAISSIAGERGRRGNPAYCASKAGLNTYLESLRNRVSSSGVRVVTAKPGFVRTAMLKGREAGTFWVVSPEQAARAIVKGAERGRGEFFVPARWSLVAAAVRAIPSFLFRKLSI
jgi:short-subunit dehydrogenase